DDTTPAACAAFEALFLPYAARHTKAALYARARAWRVPMAPMSTPVDLLENPQLSHRGFFVAPGQGPTAGLRMPGAPYKLSATPWRTGPAPALAPAPVIEELP
ncbi:MAG TPA: CoA transferase, partial [Novosphingobium sp.]|nr:CoA transferase [Novosphingobium sp.]